MTRSYRHSTKVQLTGAALLFVALLAVPLSATAQVTEITINGKSGTGDADTGTLGNDAGWKMIGPPVTGAEAQDLKADVDDNGSVIEFDLPQGGMFYRYDGEAGSSGEFVEVTSGTESLTNGRGYILFLFDDAGSNPNTDDSDPLDPDLTLQFFDSDITGGTPNTSNNVTVSELSTSSDFLLVANPFNVEYTLRNLEAPDGSGGFEDLTASSEFKNSIQIWNGGGSGSGNTSGDQAPGSYCTFDNITSGNRRIDGQYADVSSCTDGTRVAGWQAFFIERDNANGGESTATEVRFNSDGAGNRGRDIIGEKSSTNRQRVQMGLALSVENSEGRRVAQDGAAMISFHPEAQRSADGYDASKLTPLAYPYATIGPVGPTASGDSAMKAKESLPLDTDLPVTIPVRFHTEGDISGTATIEANRWRDVPSDMNATLIDTKGTPDPSDDEEHPLSPSDSVGYTFRVPESKSARQGDPPGRLVSRVDDQASASSSNADRDKPQPYVPETLSLTSRMQERAREKSSPPPTRFKVRIEGSALPVELADFGATADEERAQLTWQTASETGNAGFEVQHRRPGADAFEATGFVESKAQGGTTSEAQRYRYETDPLAAGQHTFRLRQVDLDGGATLSDPVTVEVAPSNAVQVRVAPHPVQQQATVRITTRWDEDVTVRLYDMMGREVQTLLQSSLSARASRQIRFDATALSAGTYFVRVTGETFTTTRRLTIVR